MFAGLSPCSKSEWKSDSVFDSNRRCNLSAISIERVSSRTVDALKRWGARLGHSVSSARWPAAVTGLLIVGAATWWVTHSAIFDLRTLRISGNSHLTKKQVARLGGLTRELNVLWTPPGRIERQLESHPWIKHARVSRVLPSALTVVITERRPVAVDPASSAVVAPDGTVLTKERHPAALPLIQTPQGISPDSAHRLTANGVLVARALSRTVLSRVDRIVVSPIGDVELLLKSGTTVVYGQPAEAEVKAAVLEAMLGWSFRNHARARSIDVSVPAVPTMVPMQPLQPAA